MKFQKGDKRPPNAGRKKGTLNKTTDCMRKAWIEAFDKMGGVESLMKWGQEHPTEFYRLASKLIPTQITGDATNPLVLQIENAAETLRQKFDRIAEARRIEDDKEPTDLS